jgi:two-component system cell cycle response regulator DivK
MVTPPSNISNASHFRILVIEDDYANRLFFTDFLAYSGFVVSALADGLNLEQHLKEFQPDLLLLDLGLPEIDGYTLIKTIRQSDQWHSLAIIVVSGYAFQEDKSHALALGIQHYLVKPVRLKELKQTILSVLVACYS